jgi:hypothetical protein
MKLTPLNRKFIGFMSGTGGRVLRGAMGVFLVVLAITQLGWYLAFLPLAGFMLWTAAVNYCPATLLFPELRNQPNLIKEMPSFKLK